MKPKQYYYIVAENYDHYHNWVESGRPKELIKDWQNAAFIFVHYADQLKGMTDIKGFYLPGCERNPHYREIKNFIDTIKHFAPYNTGVKQPVISNSAVNITFNNDTNEYELNGVPL